MVKNFHSLVLSKSGFVTLGQYLHGGFSFDKLTPGLILTSIFHQNEAPGRFGGGVVVRLLLPHLAAYGGRVHVFLHHVREQEVSVRQGRDSGFVQQRRVIPWNPFVADAERVRAGWTREPQRLP